MDVLTSLRACAVVVPLAVLAACEPAPLEEVPTNSAQVPGIRVSPQDMPALCRAEAADQFQTFGASLSLQEAAPDLTGGWIVEGIIRDSETPFTCRFNQDGAFLGVSGGVTDPFEAAVVDPTSDGLF